MKRRLSGIAAALASMLVLVLAPQVQASDIYPIEFTEYTLDNGLHVILHQDRSAPVVSTLLHYRVGSRDEDPTRTGFAHFFEHLMFEGTGEIPRAQIDKYVQEAGGNLNAYTSFDETVYFFQLPSNELPLALWIESQRMRDLLVDDIGVETQRGVVKEERKNRYDNAPYGSWLEKMCGMSFKGSGYSWTPIGSSQHIDSAAINEFLAFYDKFYQPNNVTLVVAGDFDEATAREYIDAYFGRFDKAPEPERNKFELPELDKEYREVVYDTKAQLPAVFIGYRGPKIGEEDYYAVAMLNDILVRGESSRLYQRLVDKDQSAVQVAVIPFNYEHSGLMTVVGVAGGGKDISIVEKTLYEELRRVAANGITDDEFQKAKNIQEADFVSGKKSNFSKASTLAQYHTYFGDANLINTEIEQFKKVSRQDIQRVAKKYFDTEKRVVLTYIPSSGEEDRAPAGG